MTHRAWMKSLIFYVCEIMHLRCNACGCVCRSAIHGARARKEPMMVATEMSDKSESVGTSFFCCYAAANDRSHHTTAPRPAETPVSMVLISAATHSSS
jgi:hypothetical protein